MSEIKKDTQLSLYPFQIIEKNNKPFFKIIRKDEILEYSPEFITSLILSKVITYIDVKRNEKKFS